MANAPSMPKIVTRGDLAGNVESFARHLRAANLTLATQRTYLASLDRLARFLEANGLRAIGVGESTAWELVTKCALDSMPAVRRRVLGSLMPRTTAALSLYNSPLPVFDDFSGTPPH